MVAAGVVRRGAVGIGLVADESTKVRAVPSSALISAVDTVPVAPVTSTVRDTFILLW